MLVFFFNFRKNYHLRQKKLSFVVKILKFVCKYLILGLMYIFYGKTMKSASNILNPAIVTKNSKGL